MLKKYIWNRELNIIAGFVKALIIIQTLVLLGGYSFDTVLPYIFLMQFFYYFINDSKWNKKEIIICSCVGIILGGFQFLESTDMNLQTLVSIMGGALLCKFIIGVLKRWEEYNTKIKVIALFLTVIVAVDLNYEGFLLNDYSVINLLTTITVIFIIYYTIIKYIEGTKENRLNWKNFVIIVGAIIFSFFSTMGHIAVFIERKSGGQFLFLLSLFCWFILYYISLMTFDNIIKEIPIYKQSIKERKQIFFVGCFAFLGTIANFIPYFLAYYPGVIEYDSWVQMGQVLGDPYNNHHPWIHTVIIKFFYEIGLALFQSENKAVAFYTAFSVSLMAFSITCVIVYLYKKNVSPIYLILLFLIYATSPINGIYAVNMWKDVPFSAISLIFLVHLSNMRDNNLSGRNNKFEWPFFIILSFFVCFLRNNGLYAYILLLPFLFFVFRKDVKRLTIVVGIIILAGIIYKGPIFKHFQVKESETIVSLSIPAQQIAAVIAENGILKSEQKELLEQIIDLDQVPEKYFGSIHCSDGIINLVKQKGNQQLIDENKKEFFNLWFQLGLQNKSIYLRAFIDQTEGYWYHKITYPFIWATYIYENGSGICRESKIPQKYTIAISQFLEMYEKHFWKYYSSGFFVYFFLFCFIIAIANKGKFIIVYIFNLGIWLTLIVATPVYADFRYIYIIYLSLPFLFLLLALDLKNCKKSYIS